ncbi:ABC transporter permease [Emticicia agri]|uniref:FtsX-like permease family protein n=1 Tax=Emticicia agri TaxID=2492393 RepID=A0A4Q5M1K3_9BACT|nr:ABC transporter permease [Emticicia agri]RYU96111.1 FtsX-like permease family protein [Emticicia agri]
MISNYFKIAFRNLLKYKGYSFINIFGLATGMAVAILIGLWIYDELSYDKYHQNYDRIAQVMQNQTYNGQVATHTSMPHKMAEEIRNNYGSDFKYVLQSSWTSSHILSVGEKKFSKSGNFFEPQVTEMLSLKMLKGTRAALNEPNSIILSESYAKAFFGNADPMDKIMRLDNKTDVKVTGVYEDLPYNSSFREMYYILPWQLYLSTNPWIKNMDDPWDSNFTQAFAQIGDNADMEAVSKKIVNVKLNKVQQDDRRYNPQVFLHPLSKWHLFPEFKDGKNIGGRVEFVWLFGIIGIFVLLLACINFMNLSTARSEKRAKEVGIRKSIGSVRSQLIVQFFSESLLVVALAFIFSLVFVQVALPYFNELADKKMTILWTNPIFWIVSIAFSIITGLIAGSYPALYLSSFQPVKVLKGTFRVGRFASVPRKVLVVLQFTVSVTLIIGTIIVFRQIQYAKDRPIGYNRNGLINIFMMTSDLHKHFDVVRNELINSGAIIEMTESGSPTTQVWNTNGGFNWEGKDPGLAVDFPNNGVSHGYGKTINWEIVSGRDFSKEFATDSTAFVVNESAVKFIGFKDPIGKIIKWNDKPYTIIGVIKDMVVQSPYAPTRGSLYHLSKDSENVMILKLNPNKSSRESISKIEAIFKKYDPASPFEYKFVDEEYAQKFGDEERVGKLATFFAILAVFISCLGLFGLASFVAEQRTKEIGVRKVLGASVMNLWQLLSKDFVILVLISCFISIPIAYFYLNGWLQRYEYRTGISWWVFIVSVAGALLITLLTVSFQAIKAATANPVKSLKTE